MLAAAFSSYLKDQNLGAIDSVLRSTAICNGDDAKLLAGMHESTHMYVMDKVEKICHAVIA